MIRYLPTGALILCVCIGLAAQTGLKYKTYQGTADGFSVTIPFEMQVRGDADSLSGRKYYGSGDGTWVYIFSEPNKRLYDIDTIKRFLRSNGYAFTVGSDAKHP